MKLKHLLTTGTFNLLSKIRALDPHWAERSENGSRQSRLPVLETLCVSPPPIRVAAKCDVLQRQPAHWIGGCSSLNAAFSGARDTTDLCRMR
jgi:hypothetical protein